MPIRRTKNSRLRIASACLAATSVWVSLAQAHAASEPKSAKAEAAASLERRATLGAARSWGYQLRIRDLAPVAASPADLLVIDHGYAARRNGKTMFDPADVTPLKTKPDGRRRAVLAYLSIGEAEQYRYYWQGEWCQRVTARWLPAPSSASSADATPFSSLTNVAANSSTGTPVASCAHKYAANGSC